MSDKGVLPNNTQNKTLSRPALIRDVFIVGSPIIIAGVLGNLIGIDTLTGGAIINLGYLAMMVIGWLLLKSQKSSWREIGLTKPDNKIKTTALGIAAFFGALIVFVLTQSIMVAVLSALGLSPSELDQSRFNPIQGNLPLFILMLILAWTTIAFGEELFFRAFLITRMTDIKNMGRWTAILIAGAIFGLVHFSEGPLGVLANASFGILFGWIFVRSSRNLWITIIGHGLLNTIRFTVLFLGLA